jgi:hypothetical protein
LAFIELAYNIRQVGCQPSPKPVEKRSKLYSSYIAKITI